MLHIFSKNETVEPRIVVLDKPIAAVGLSIRTGMKSVFKDLPKVYDRYMKLKAQNGIPNIKEPWEYVSLSKNFTDEKSWDYYTGHVVTSRNAVAEEFLGFEVPAGTYAVFPIRGKGKLFFGMAVGKMKKYIYETWLPQSQYEFGGYEFEYNNEAMHAENPYAIDLYVAINGK